MLERIVNFALSVALIALASAVTIALIRLAFSMHAFVGVVMFLLALRFWTNIIFKAVIDTRRQMRGY